jgi:hypothetical protein
LSNRGKLQSCKGQAYRWTQQTQMFEFSKALTDRLSSDFCRGMPAKLYAPPKLNKVK